MLRLSFLNMAGEFTFSNNSGIVGGAISITDDSRVSQSISKYFEALNNFIFTIKTKQNSGGQDHFFLFVVLDHN